MKFFPYEHIVYTSLLSPEEVLRRLQENTEPEKFLRMPTLFGGDNLKPYEGRIGEDSFSIRRIIRYRNSFLPRIKGTVEREYGQTQIIVKMRLHIFVMIFVLFWMGGISIVFLAFLANPGIPAPTLLGIAGMFLFGYILTTGGFKYESGKSKKFLAELFEAEMEA